jgi:hypothetical protein
MVAQGRDLDQPPFGGGAPLTGGPAAGARLARAEASEQGQVDTAAAEIIPPGSFEQLWLIYKRPYADNEASSRRAFDAACQRATPKEIIEGARTWVEVAGTANAEFLPEPVKWLTANSWTKAPPKRWQNKQHTASGRASHGHGRRNGVVIDVANVMFNLGRRS